MHVYMCRYIRQIYTCMYIHVCIYVYTYVIRVDVHICMYNCFTKHVCVSLGACVAACVYARACTFTYMYVCERYVYVRMYICMYVCMHACMYVCMCVYACKLLSISVCLCVYICIYRPELPGEHVIGSYHSQPGRDPFFQRGRCSQQMRPANGGKVTDRKLKKPELSCLAQCQEQFQVGS